MVRRLVFQKGEKRLRRLKALEREQALKRIMPNYRAQNRGHLGKATLQHLYFSENKSVLEISKFFKCSVHKVYFWMEKYKLERRSKSEAAYVKNNPNGDPFLFKTPHDLKSAELLGFGLGLYWGEGTKADKASVRLGNADPNLILKFIEFLEVIFKIKRSDLKFGLQIFSDISEKEAVDFWIKNIKISKAQFYKVIITPSRGIGTYRKKNKYGVMTVYYHNKKLRDLLVGMLPL